MNPSLPDPDTDPLYEDRRWRAVLLWTLRNLKQSILRRRTLSLPNLCRLFDRRWQAHAGHAHGRKAGRAVLAAYYRAYQPFLAAPAHWSTRGGQQGVSPLWHSVSPNGGRSRTG